MHPLDLVIAAPWRRLAFTTYALSLSFFEAVVLDAMIRGGARDAIVFADPTGIKAALSEHGARRVGREYYVEPVACLTGAFHPKIGVFSSDDDCHVTIGSGNLTFGGWGGNAEIIEHLHPSFAADAFDDLAEMLELLTVSEHVRTEAGDSLLTVAQDVRKGAIGAARTGKHPSRPQRRREHCKLDQGSGRRTRRRHPSHRRVTLLRPKRARPAAARPRSEPVLDRGARPSEWRRTGKHRVELAWRVGWPRGSRPCG